MLNQVQRWSAAIAMLTGLCWIAVAQPTQQIPDKTLNPIDTSTAFGAPKVQITEVKGQTAKQNGFQARVRWSAQIPSTTKIEKFEISVSIKDSNGKTSTASQTAAGAARELAVPVPITAKPVSFQANIITFFVPIAQQKRELNGSFVLDKSNGFSSSGSTGQSSPQPPGNALTKVQLADNTALKGFDVSWRLAPVTQDLSENQSKISSTFTYKKSNQTIATRSVNATVGSGTRQVRLTVSAAPVASLVDVKIEAVVKVEVFFNLLQRTSTNLSGSFPN